MYEIQVEWLWLKPRLRWVWHSIGLRRAIWLLLWKRRLRGLWGCSSLLML